MIYIYWAPPRQGKTYCVTKDVKDLLTEGKRTVFSNFPIIVKMADGTYRAPSIWKPELVRECIVSATIVIDEAYIDYNSRNYQNFKVDTHTFFATNGHNDIDIILIAQNPARIDVVIREMCSSFIYVKKTAVPEAIWIIYAKLVNKFLGWDVDVYRPQPLFFKTYTYLTEKQMATMNADDAWCVSTYWFDKKVAECYNTHQYRKQGSIYKGDSWLTRFKLVEPPTSVTPQETPSGSLPCGVTPAEKIKNGINRIKLHFERLEKMIPGKFSIQIQELKKLADGTIQKLKFGIRQAFCRNDRK